MAKAKAPGKTCKNCGKQFTPTRNWQEFHSKSCRDAYKREQELQDYVCAYCGLFAEHIDYIPPRDIRPMLKEMGLVEKYPVEDVRCCTNCRKILDDRDFFWTFKSRLEVIQDDLRDFLGDSDYVGTVDGVGSSNRDYVALMRRRLNYESKK